MSIRVTQGSDNVFADMGFGPGEAVSRLIRTDLVMAIAARIKESGLTQKQAEKLFGVTQPRVSDIVRGRIERFSIDALVAMLTRLGVEVRLELRKRRVRSA